MLTRYPLDIYFWRDSYSMQLCIVYCMPANVRKHEFRWVCIFLLSNSFISSGNSNLHDLCENAIRPFCLDFCNKRYHDKHPLD